MKKALFIQLLLLAATQTIKADRPAPTVAVKKITIEGQVPAGYDKNQITLTTFPVFTIQYISGELKKLPNKIVNGYAKWEINTNKAIYLKTPFLGQPSIIGFHMEPGETIAISYKDGQPVFAGSAAKKFQLIHQLNLLEDSLKETTLWKSLSGEYTALKSVDDYFAWNSFLTNKMQLSLRLLDSYRKDISNYSYNVIKEKILYEIEEKRIGRFMQLCAITKLGDIYVSNFGLTNDDLCAIYDSTIYGPGSRWLQYEAPLVGDPYYLYLVVGTDVLRKQRKFIRTGASDTGDLYSEKGERYLARYNLAKEKYKGIQRDEVLAFMFYYVRGFIYKAGFIPEVEAMLADYYRQPTSNQAYKATVKEYELEQRERWGRKGMLDFSLTDSIGRSFTKTNMKGKIGILDFWFTGCKGCIPMAAGLKKVEQYFKQDTSVVFISVSIDEDREMWLNSIQQRKYTTGTGVQLYTGGKSSDHEMIKYYGIDGYPTLILFDAYGMMLRPKENIDPRNNNEGALINLINRELLRIKDGPYVLDENGQQVAYSLNGNHISKDDAGRLRVQTDDRGKTFEVTLQKTVIDQPSSFSRPQKLIVLSDIEGNFDAFRKLLQANKIIDENYNWIFGNGHLVFGGDMFDRGNQVTECLWLIYSLEEKAREAGGYVHFVLGNHEIMNLQGDHRYAQIKYEENAKLLGKTIQQLFGENSELGRWLRTRNIIEKVGDLLFVHGGISSKINESALTIDEINSLARPNYAQKKDDYGNNDINLVMSSSYGPFWYRGYYQNLPVENMIDSILKKYDVKHIITGHTIVADTVSARYNNKIINTDTKHAEGKSEAILIEGTKFYRVNNKGQRWLLFDDAEKLKEQ